VGLVTLVLSSRGLVHAVHGAFHVIFPEDQHRPNLVRAWIIPLIIIPIAFLLVGLAAAIQAVLGFLAQYDFLGENTAALLRALNLMLAYVILWGLILNTYWALPKPHPAWRQAALLAFLAAFTMFLLVWGGLNSSSRWKSTAPSMAAWGGVVFILIGAYLAGSVFYLWAQCLYTLGKVDVEALEKLFLAQDPNHEGPGALERYVFGRADRLLNKYGRSVAAGTVLIREGDTSREAFFLYRGQAGLYKTVQGHDQKLGSLGEGQLFGEMAYLLGEARTATVTAETDLVVLVFPPELLEELMAYSAPLSRRIIGTLAQRLVRMNQAVGQG
jgi:membrane protein